MQGLFRFSSFRAPLRAADPPFAAPRQDFSASRRGKLGAPKLGAHRRIPLLLFAVILTFSLPLSRDLGAQNREGKELFAPFVSRIQAQQQGRRITISWKDSSDITQGRYLVYRLREEITDGNFSSAQFLGAVEPGVQEYTDTPEAPGDYYYAVVIEGEDQTLYDIFIPYRNKTTRPRTVEGEVTSRDQAARVRDIRASREGDQVIITFQSSQPGRTLALYRGTKAFSSAGELTKARRVASAESSRSRFQDFPVPGIPYYYAVADQALLQEGKLSLEPGENATIQSVQIPLSDQVRRLLPERTAARSLPLPALLMKQRITDGNRLNAQPAGMPAPEPLSPEAAQAASALAEQFPPGKPADPEPETLPGDKASSGGEDPHPALTAILEGTFSKGQWQASQNQLLNYLSRPRTAEEEARGRFYLGQALFFQGKERNAFLEMVQAAEEFPQAGRRWQDRILTALAEQEDRADRE